MLQIFTVPSLSIEQTKLLRGEVNIRIGEDEDEEEE